MDASIQHAAKFLNAISNAIGRLENFAYSLVLRFNAVKRRSASAHMSNGGHVCIACSFPVDDAGHRWLIWGIDVEWTTNEWCVQATAEEEDDSNDPSTTRYWESVQFRAATLDEFVGCLDSALDEIEKSLTTPQIAEIFEKYRNTKDT